MKLKERIERTQTLILEHKSIVERMEERLTQLREIEDKHNVDPLVLSIMSQIEFYLLNLKIIITQDEIGIEDMIQQEKYEEMQRVGG